MLAITKDLELKSLLTEENIYLLYNLLLTPQTFIHMSQKKCSFIHCSPKLSIQYTGTCTCSELLQTIMYMSIYTHIQISLKTKH